LLAYTEIPGRSGCALAKGTTTDQVDIPVAEINAADYKAIRKAVLEGQLIFATLTSEGTYFTLLSAQLHKNF